MSLTEKITFITLKTSGLPQVLPGTNANGSVDSNRKVLRFNNIYLKNVLRNVLDKNNLCRCRLSWFIAGQIIQSTVIPYCIVVNNFVAPYVYDPSNSAVVTIATNNPNPNATALNSPFTNEAVVGIFQTSNTATPTNAYVAPKESSYVTVYVPDDDYLEISLRYAFSNSTTIITGTNSTLPNFALCLEFIPYA